MNSQVQDNQTNQPRSSVYSPDAILISSTMLVIAFFVFVVKIFSVLRSRS